MPDSSPSSMENGLATAVRTAVVLVLVAPLIVMVAPLPQTFFPFIVGKALYIRSLVEIAFVLWLVLAFWYPSHRLPRSWIVPALAAYVFVALISSLLGVSPQRSLWSTYERMQGWIDLAHWFAFTVVVVSVFRSFRDWKTLLQFNLAISFIMSLLGLAQMNDISVLGYLSGGGRINITLGNATFVGAYMLVNILIALAFLAHSMVQPDERSRPQASRRVERSRRRTKARSTESTGLGIIWWQVFWVAIIALDGLMLVRSGTRGAVIGLAMGLLAFAVAYIACGKIPRVRIVSATFVGALVIIVIGFVAVRDTDWFQVVADSNQLIGRLSNIGLDDPSTRGRINSARIGFDGFLDRPIFGWGPENYTIAYDGQLTAEVASISTESFDQAHNKIIEEMVTKGALGVGAYMAVWLIMLWVVIRRIKEQQPALQLFTMLIGAAASAYFIQNLFLFDTPGTVGQFYLLAGFIVFIETAPATALDPSATSPGGLEGVPGWATRFRFLQTDQWKSAGIIVASLVAMSAIYFLTLGPYVGSKTVLLGMRSFTYNAPVQGVVQHVANVSDRLNVGDNVVGLDTPTGPTTFQAPTAGIICELAANGQQVGPGGSMARLIPLWDETLDHFEDSISASPGLANYPRRWLLTTLNSCWHTLSDEDLQRVLPLLESELEDALDAEPKEWRIHLSFANLYQTAGRRDPRYLPVARNLLKEAIYLAPERIELIQLQVRQFVVEGDPQGALAVVDDYIAAHAEYLTADSEISAVFDSMRRDVEGVIEAAGAGSTSDED